MTPKKIASSMLFLLLVTALFTLHACSSNKGPTNPNPTTPVPTPTLSPTPVPGLYWQTATIYRETNGGVPYQYAYVNLTVNGQAVTNVNVVVTGSALATPVTLPYSGVVVSQGLACANYSMGPSSTLNYQPGQSYTLTTTSGVLTATSSIAIAGNITNALDGSQASWTVNGNQASVIVTNSFGAPTYSNLNITSPFSIPVTAYPGPGSYALTTRVTNTTASITGGTLNTAPGYGFFVYDELITTLALLAPTFTPTPTGSATNTPTFSVTPTPTGSATYTPTFSFTSTPTWSFTFTPTSTFTSTFTSTSTWTPIPTPPFVTSWASTGTTQANISGGILYVIDSTNDQVLKYSLAGTASTPVGGYGTGNGQFNNPTGVVADASGTIYVADFLNNRIQALDGTTGAFAWKAGSLGSGNGQFSHPTQTALDGLGNVYVTDQGNHRIDMFTTAGIFNGAFSGSGPITFNDPVAIVGDAVNGFIYIADQLSYQVVKLDTAGNFITRWGTNGTGPGQFEILEAIAVNPAGTRVYVCDVGSGTSNVQVFDPNGNYLTGWGGKGNGVYQFGGSGGGYGPAGIAVDSSGYLYVVDPGNGVIKKFGP